MIPLCADLWLELDEQFAIIACDVQASVAAPHLCGTLSRHSIMAALGAELGRIAPQIRMGLRQSWPPQSHMLSILSEGEARRYLATFTRRDGGAGAIVPGYLAMLRDLSGATHTCDVAASTAQQATRIHLQSMLEALPDALALFDRDQRLVMCNNAYLAVFPGLGDMLVPGQSFADILKTGLRRGILQVTDCSEAAWIARQIRKFALQYSQSRLRALHGRWYREAQHPTPDGGRIIILSDVTDWKDTETRALEDRARALDASRDGVFLVSIDGKVQYANPAAIGILREDRREALLGQDWCALLLPCHPKIARDTVCATLAQAGFWQGQSFFATEDDETVELESSVTRNADGTVLCVFRDITLQRLNEIERERLREQLTLARRREDIAQIAAGLAHDFNNILAGISAASSIIAEMEDIETAKPLALRISEACGQAGGLLKRMLSLGKTDTPRELLDLRRPLRDAESLLRPSLRAPVTLMVDLPQTPLMTYADSTALVQMALNLVINARDAILAQPVMRAEAGIRVALALATPQDLAQRFDIGTVDKRVSYARITVADDGPGLSAEMRANIFTPYFSTKGADGTGLGLAIVLSVIQ
ncbi:MAG: PAS-domain containing protein, partial [Roseinatronobacter sp.]|nr:PAS-domain containing protein [Roseinatronobacter sp.]